MSPNTFIVIPMEHEPKVRPVRPPHGELVHFGINPFTKNIVFSYQSNKVSLEYIDLIIKQLYSEIMAMDKFGKPQTLAALVEYVKDGNPLPPDAALALKEIA